MTEERHISTRRVAPDPLMTFGKFGPKNGTPLRVSELPDDYLAWLVSGADVRSPELQAAIEAEWKRRSPRNVDMVERERKEPTVDQWFVFVPGRPVEVPGGKPVVGATEVYGPFGSDAEAGRAAKEKGGRVTGPWPSKVDPKKVKRAGPVLKKGGW